MIVGRGFLENTNIFFVRKQTHILLSWMVLVFFAQYQDFILKSHRAALLTTKEATESAYTILCIYINQYRRYWEEQRNKYSISFLTVFKWTLCCRSVLQLNAIRMNFIAAKVRTVHWYFVDEFVVSRSFLIIKCICIFPLRQIAFLAFFKMPINVVILNYGFSLKREWPKNNNQFICKVI